MRVTKIIKEYVEKTVGEKYEADMKAIKEAYEPPENIETFKVFLDKAKREFYDKVAMKSDELGIKWGPVYQDGMSFKKYLKYREQCFTGRMFEDDIYDDKYQEEVTNKINILRHEKRDAVDEILIRLELGEIDKKQLDEILKEYK